MPLCVIGCLIPEAKMPLQISPWGAAKNAAHSCKPEDL
jgi:hypothetical protein